MYRLRGFKIIYLLYYTIWLVYSILYVLCVLTLKTLGNDSLIFWCVDYLIVFGFRGSYYQLIRSRKLNWEAGLGKLGMNVFILVYGIFENFLLFLVFLVFCLLFYHVLSGFLNAFFFYCDRCVNICSRMIRLYNHSQIDLGWICICLMAGFFYFPSPEVLAGRLELPLVSLTKIHRGSFW